MNAVRAFVLVALIAGTVTLCSVNPPVHSQARTPGAAAGAAYRSGADLNAGDARRMCRILRRLSGPMPPEDPAAIKSALAAAVDQTFASGAMPFDEVVAAVDELAQDECPTARDAVLEAAGTATLRDALVTPDVAIGSTAPASGPTVARATP